MTTIQLERTQKNLKKASYLLLTAAIGLLLTAGFLGLMK